MLIKNMAFRKMSRFKKNLGGQTILEYTLILGAVIFILFTMSPMIRRYTQGMIKVMADQIGNQRNSDQTFGDTGHLESSDVNSFVTSTKSRRDIFGRIIYDENESTTTSSQVQVNLGITTR